VEVHPDRNLVLRLFRRFVPLTDTYRGTRFLVREERAYTRGGQTRSAVRVWATPLLVVLVLVEVTDLLFAVDSVPAILAISRQQFVVFSSNALAILGLRALYFLVASATDSLVHLNKGLAVILGFVGVKMICGRWVVISTWLSLAVIAVVLAATVAASLAANRRRDRAASTADAR
jgi:tellurite resistance protein TerC